MGIRKLKIWIIFLLAIVVVGFMLFQQSQNNKIHLDNQAIRNLEMVKNKFFSFYRTFLAEQEDKFVRYVINENLEEKESFKEWGKFSDSLRIVIQEKYEEFEALESKVDNDPSIHVVLTNGQFAIKKEGHPVNMEFFEDEQIELKDRFKNYPKIDLEVPLASVLSLSAEHDFFEKILLADGNGEILYPQSESGKKLIQLTESKGTDLPINKSEILHQDQTYLLYYTPFLVEDKKFIIAGLISKTHFESLGFRVDFSYLALLLFLLALMIFSLPTISLFGFRRGDILTRFKVFSVGLSLFGFMLLMGVGFAFLKDHHPLTKKEHSSQRNHISQAIKTQIDLNIEMLKNPFHRKDLLEYLTIDSLGRMGTLILGEKKLPGKGSFINLKNREYFKYFEGIIASDEEKVEPAEFDFFIGSHYSRKDKSLETVISNYDNISKEVQAVTFAWKPLDSLSEKHRFIFVKDNGDVIYKSRMVKAPFENLSQLLSVEEWLLLKKTMQNNRNIAENFSWEMTFYVDGYSYKLNLQKLNFDNFDKSTWLIYLQDEHLEHSFSFLVVIEVIVLLAGYIFLLILLSIVRWVNRPEPKCGLWKDFIYDHLYPSGLNSKNYLILIFLFLIQMMVMLGLYHNSYVSVFTLYFSSLCIMIFSSQVSFIFLEMKWDRKADISSPEERDNRLYAVKFLGMTFLIMTLLAIFFSGALQPSYSVYLIAIILSLFSFICFLLKIYFEEFLKKVEHIEPITLLKGQIPWLHTNHLYAWFFVVWITLIGFIPGYMIYSKTFLHEKEIWHNKSEVIQDMDGDISDWSNNYSLLRRDLFTAFPVREEGELLEFISPPKANVDYIINSKTEKNPDFVTFFKNRFMMLKNGTLQTALRILILVLFIWLIYWLNKSIVRKIFFADGINPKLGETISDVQCRLLEERSHGQNEDKGNVICKFIYLHRLISDGNKELVAKLLKIETVKILSFDGKISDVLGNFSFSQEAALKTKLEEKNTILLENLHCIGEDEIFLQRLSWLMNFCLEHDITLVLVTGVSWRHLLSKVKGDQAKLHYSEVFSPFVFAYIPIKNKDFSKRNFDRINKIIDENEDIKNDLETKLLLRQRFFKADYTNIWEELSTEEKMVTYEFAVNEFLNYAAAPVIIELIQKGILVFDSNEDRYTLFSDTFRYFVLLHISREEKDDFRNLEIRTGNADSIQIAVFSFVLISVALISYFDKNFLDQATSYVTGIIGALGGLYSVFRSNFLKNKKEVSA